MIGRDALLRAAALAQGPHPGELEYLFAEKMVDAVEPLIREQIAQAIEALWDEQCSGFRNTGTCESCRAFDDVLTYAVRIARREQR